MAARSKPFYRPSRLVSSTESSLKSRDRPLFKYTTGFVGYINAFDCTARLSDKLIDKQTQSINTPAPTTIADGNHQQFALSHLLHHLLDDHHKLVWSPRN